MKLQPLPLIGRDRAVRSVYENIRVEKDFRLNVHAARLRSSHYPTHNHSRPINHSHEPMNEDMIVGMDDLIAMLVAHPSPFAEYSDLFITYCLLAPLFLAIWVFCVHTLCLMISSML